MQNGYHTQYTYCYISYLTRPLFFSSIMASHVSNILPSSGECIRYRSMYSKPSLQGITEYFITLFKETAYF